MTKSLMIYTINNRYKLSWSFDYAKNLGTAIDNFNKYNNQYGYYIVAIQSVKNEECFDDILTKYKTGETI